MAGMQSALLVEPKRNAVTYGHTPSGTATLVAKTSAATAPMTATKTCSKTGQTNATVRRRSRGTVGNRRQIRRTDEPCLSATVVLSLGWQTTTTVSVGQSAITSQVPVV